jgi:hypothetical protein
MMVEDMEIKGWIVRSDVNATPCVAQTGTDKRR